MSKQVFITTLLALVTLNGQAQKGNYTIKGMVDDADTKVVYLGPEDNDYKVLDSAKVINGEFTFSGKIEKPIPAFITNKHRQMLYMLILEPGNITCKNQVFAVGGALNDSLMHLNQYAKTTANNEAKFEQYAEAMYLRHRNDALGLKILLMCFSPSDKLRLYNMGGPMIKEYPPFVSDKETWAKYEATKEGKKMVDIKSAVDGKSLSDYVGKGKYVLVDFWASWCPPCREEIPNIIAAYNKYKKRGLQVLGMIVDDDKKSADKAIEQLKIPYPQIYGINFKQLKTYGTDGIPHIILFGPDGTILARGLRGEGIDRKLKEILGE